VIAVSSDAIVEWRSIVQLVRGAVAVLPEGGLERVSSSTGMTVREQVHHIVEANIVAASIVIAALGMPGATYDWSWMMPFGEWMDRLDHRSRPIEPSLELLDALNRWIAAVVEQLPDGLEREVVLKVGDNLSKTTVAKVLLDEAEHAKGHVEAIATALHA
jgi:hypothetical protein